MLQMCHARRWRLRRMGAKGRRRGQWAGAAARGAGSSAAMSLMISGVYIGCGATARGGIGGEDYRVGTREVRQAGGGPSACENGAVGRPQRDTGYAQTLAEPEAFLYSALYALQTAAPV